jgi:predicted GIY-YIG superfamily endonuclease
VSKRTAVYRFYDAADRLLYVGMTENPAVRFTSHESLKPWWPDVARQTINWYDTREEADAVETEAIRTERAVHNVAGSPWAPPPRELSADEMLISDLRRDFAEVVTRVDLCKQVVTIVGRTRRRHPVAAVVPADLAEAINALGGPDAALALLRPPVA